MKKLLIVFTVFLIANIHCFAETTLKGSVAYTVETARKMAFEGLELKIDKQKIKPFLYDENNEENKIALKNNIQPEGRYLIAFDLLKGKIKGYAVVYDNKPEYAYYYTNSGYLVAFDIDNKKQEGSFPYKIGKYSALTGNLISIALYISEEEQYAYTKNGKLKAHWIGNTGYNEKGKPIAHRRSANEIPSE